DQTLRPFDSELGNGRVVFGGTVEGRVDDLALDRALHVGDLLRPLVDEDDHEVALGVVLGDRVGDRLQHRRLTRLGRGDDEAALPLADGRDEVDDPRGEDMRRGFEAQPLLRVQRDQLGELGPVARPLGRHAVHAVQPDQRVELLPTLAFARLAHRSGDGVTLAQAVLADLGQRNVDVVGTGQVAGGPHERVVVEDVQDARDRQEDGVLADHRLLVSTLPVAAVTAVTAASPAAGPSAVLLVVAVALGAVLLLGGLLVAASVAVTAATAPLPGAVLAVLGGLCGCGLLSFCGSRRRSVLLGALSGVAALGRRGLRGFFTAAAAGTATGPFRLFSRLCCSFLGGLVRLFCRRFGGGSLSRGGGLLLFRGCGARGF